MWLAKIMNIKIPNKLIFLSLAALLVLAVYVGSYIPNKTKSNITGVPVNGTHSEENRSKADSQNKYQELTPAPRKTNLSTTQPEETLNNRQSVPTSTQRNPYVECIIDGEIYKTHSNSECEYAQKLIQGSRRSVRDLIVIPTVKYEGVPIPKTEPNIELPETEDAIILKSNQCKVEAENAASSKNYKCAVISSEFRYDSEEYRKCLAEATNIHIKAYKECLNR